MRFEATVPDSRGNAVVQLADELGLSRSQLVDEALALPPRGSQRRGRSWTCLRAATRATTSPCPQCLASTRRWVRTSKAHKALMKTPTALPRYYRCRTVSCGRQIVASEAERLAREIVAEAPSNWPNEVKERMRVIAQAWPHMWSRSQRLALEELFESMSWHAEPERLEVALCVG